MYFDELRMNVDDLKARFNSYIVTAFDDSMTVEMMMRSYVKFIKENMSLTNDMVEYLNNFTETFDEKLYPTVFDVLNEWKESGVLNDVINKTIFNELSKEIKAIDNKLAEKRNIYDKLNKQDYDLSKKINLWNINDFDDETRRILLSGEGEINGVLGDNVIKNNHLTPQVVTPDKTTFVTSGDNLFNKNNVVLGQYMTEKGSIHDDSKYLTYTINNVKNNEWLNIFGSNYQKRYFRYITAFDYQGNVLEEKGLNNVATAQNEGVPFLIQNGVSKLVVSLPTTFIEGGLDVMIAYGKYEKEYQPYTPALLETFDFSDKQKKYLEDNSRKFFKSNNDNLVVEAEKVDGKYMSISGVETVSSNYYYVVIPVKKGDVITAKDNNNRKINMRIVTAYLTTGKAEPSLGMNNETGNISSYTVMDDRIVKLAISINKNKVSGIHDLTGTPLSELMIYKDKEIDYVAPFYTLTDSVRLGEEQLKQLNIGKSDDDDIKGVKVLVGGTSISYGHATGVSYADQLSEYYGAEVSKIAVNGATMKSIYNQFKNYQGKPDIIVLDGGANDNTVSLENLNVGVLTNGYNNSFDDTLYGNTEKLFKYLLETFKVPIIFIHTHKMYTRPKDTEKKVHDVIKECCLKWGVDRLDLYNQSFLNTNISSIRNMYTYDKLGETTGGNGTHVNELGYLKGYTPLVKEKISSYVI